VPRAAVDGSAEHRADLPSKAIDGAAVVIVAETSKTTPTLLRGDA
jgi:hypothetical protein